MKVKIAVGFLALAFVALGVWYVFRGNGGNIATETFDSGYDLVLQDFSGNEVRLSEYRRSALIVYVWASWCPYCSLELEQLAKIQQEYGDGVSIVAVNRAEPRADAEQFTSKLAVSEVALLLDPDDALYKGIEGYAMPEMLFINKGGDIVSHQRGPIQESAIRAQLESMLAL